MKYLLLSLLTLAPFAFSATQSNYDHSRHTMLAKKILEKIRPPQKTDQDLTLITESYLKAFSVVKKSTANDQDREQFQKKTHQLLTLSGHKFRKVEVPNIIEGKSINVIVFDPTMGLPGPAQSIGKRDRRNSPHT